MISRGKPLAFEHRVVAERVIGRFLALGEAVHHIDRNPRNNSPENLRVLSVPDHKRLHRYGDIDSPRLIELADVTD
jgi:hypothetical protein